MHVYEVHKDGKVVGRVKIKKTIKEYAIGAISELNAQLATIKSAQKRSRITTRIGEWTRVLETVEAQQAENLAKAEEIKNEQKE